MNSKEYDALGKGEEICRNITNLKSDLKSIQTSSSRILDSPLLSEGQNYFYILHSVDVFDTSRSKLTKLQLIGKSFSEIWTVTLPNLYNDPDKAKAKGAFETVFSSGNPQFGYKWFDMEDGKLIIIAQLRMLCLDTETGKILCDNPL
jgi:hypothetical protein